MGGVSGSFPARPESYPHLIHKCLILCDLYYFFVDVFCRVFHPPPSSLKERECLPQNVAIRIVDHSEIAPGNRRTVGCSWCARLPVTSVRWKLDAPAAKPGRKEAIADARASIHGLQRPGSHRAAICDNLKSGSWRRETAPRWRKPSGWLSEKPVNVSIAGGNAVTAKVLVATANQHGCPRLRETTSPQDPHPQWGNARGGGRREGTAPGKAWTTF